MDNNISSKAMLVRLAISQWTGRKHDKKVTDKIEVDYGAFNSGRFNKLLLDDSALKKIQSIVNNVRTFHKHNTLPWNNNGERILPCENFNDYRAAMSVFKEIFDTEVLNFLENYNSYVENAEKRLNKMFNKKDYPHVSELSEKYNLHTIINPLPVSDDFRVSLNEEEINIIKNNIEDRLNEGVNYAMNDLWHRLFDVISTMSLKLEDNEAVFRDSLINNIKDLIDILPKLNIQNDEDLISIREEIEEKICKFDPQDLRDDNLSRKNAVKDVNEIIDQIKDFIGK